MMNLHAPFRIRHFIASSNSLKLVIHDIRSKNSLIDPLRWRRARTAHLKIAIDNVGVGPRVGATVGTGVGGTRSG